MVENESKTVVEEYKYSKVSILYQKIVSTFTGNLDKKNIISNKNKEESHFFTNKILEKALVLIKYGIPGTVMLSFLALNMVAWYPKFVNTYELAQAEYTGEFAPHIGELHSENGRALIVVHKGFASTNLFERIQGVEKREDYSDYLDALSDEIEKYLLNGDIVVYIVGSDVYNSENYPYSDNIMYIVSEPFNSSKSTTVVDGNNWYSQDSDIASLLASAGVEQVQFAGEYAGACVQQARDSSFFADFEDITNEDLIFDK